jgi:hypothetical protein
MMLEIAAKILKLPVHFARTHSARHLCLLQRWELPTKAILGTLCDGKPWLLGAAGC